MRFTCRAAADRGRGGKSAGNPERAPRDFSGSGVRFRLFNGVIIVYYRMSCKPKRLSRFFAALLCSRNLKDCRPDVLSSPFSDFPLLPGRRSSFSRGRVRFGGGGLGSVLRRADEPGLLRRRRDLSRVVSGQSFDPRRSGARTRQLFGRDGAGTDARLGDEGRTAALRRTGEGIPRPLFEPERRRRARV